MSKNLPRPNLSRHGSVLADEVNDPDLQRVMDLVDLHYSVKEKHLQEKDMNLQKARLAVQRVAEVGPDYQ
jgi:hypothetical protein